MIRFARLTALAAAGAFLAGTSASAEMVRMSATLRSAGEAGGTASPGTGRLAVSYDTATKQLTWEGTYSGLTGPATMAHFHGPAEPGKNAPVLIPSPAASPIKGAVTLTDAQAAAVTNGQTYFNIHTAANPGGEIRGQVTR